MTKLDMKFKKSILKNFSILQFSIVAIILIVVASFFLNSQFLSFNKFLASAQTSNTPLTGYAWSSNIGWISFNCINAGSSNCNISNYSVKIDPVTGKLTGYAWSSNIGWIKFDPDIINLGGNAPKDPQQGAKLNSATNIVEGWARAALPIAFGGSAGGWDGWIKMSGTTTGGSSYGVQYDSTNKKLTGYAWGGDVIGWISFSGATYAVGYSGSSTSNQLITQVSPLVYGETTQITVQYYDGSNWIDVTSSITDWASSDTTIATINSSGNITAGSKTGNTNIIYSYQDVNYSSSISVNAPIPTLSIFPNIVSMDVNSTQNFTAMYDSDGNGPQSASDVSASWTKTGNITLSASTGKTITATAGNSESSATITVKYTPPGGTEFIDTLNLSINLYAVCGTEGAPSCGGGGGGGGEITGDSGGGEIIGDSGGGNYTGGINTIIQAYLSQPENEGKQVFYQASTEKMEEYKSSPAVPSVCTALNYPNFFWTPLPAIYKDITFTGIGNNVANWLWSFAPNAVPSSASVNPAVTKFASIASKTIILKAYDSSGNYCKRTKTLQVGGRMEQ